MKILPYARLILAIQQIMLQPGKWNDFQHWHGQSDDGPEDSLAVVPPLTFQDWLSSWLDGKPMAQIHDSWAWRAIQAGLERRNGGRWGMEDVCVNTVAQQFVSLPCGLVIAINIDWYVNVNL